VSITELIKHVGEENILVQPLGRSVTNATYRKKQRDTLVTFSTTQMQCTDLLLDSPDQKIGLILWLPKSKLPAQ